MGKWQLSKREVTMSLFMFSHPSQTKNAENDPGQEVAISSESL